MAELHDDLRIAVMRLARRVRLERAADDITDARLSVLFVLLGGGPQTLTSLSEHERVTPPSMNRTVNSLVDDGLAVRTPDPDDKRKMIIDITDAGQDVALETRRRRVAWFADHVAELGDDERSVLEAALPILRRLADS
ncbi:MAG TPA: MarR family transcriptional regulator [Rhodoglobus sp.]|nr:MarR family transcriptional regulator [Rhodoglobus sp.]